MMGVEYRVRFKRRDVAALDAYLRSLPCFSEYDGEWRSYNYREQASTGNMPNAEIRVEDDGIYLCDYGMSRHLFGCVVTALVSRFGSVQIEDYER